MVTAGEAGGYVMFGCGFAAPGHPRNPGVSFTTEAPFSQTPAAAKFIAH
jgi:hypothetical protein